MNIMENVAFNYTGRPNLNAIVVKRKGKVIKGETAKLRAEALTEWKPIRNAAKRARRAMRTKR